MRKKVLTPQCPSCNLLETHIGKLQCHWGKTAKLLVDQKGKTPKTCKLKQGKDND